MPHTFLLAANPITGLVNQTVDNNTNVVISSIGLSVDLLILLAALIAIPLIIWKVIIKMISVHAQPGGISQITGYLLTSVASLVVAILVAATPTPIMALWNKLAASIGGSLPQMIKSGAVKPIQTVYDAVYKFVSEVVLSIGDAGFFALFLGLAIFGIGAGLLKFLKHQDQEQFMGKAVTMLILGVVSLVIVVAFGNMGRNPGILTQFLNAVGAKIS